MGNCLTKMYEIPITPGSTPAFQQRPAHQQDQQLPRVTSSTPRQEARTPSSPFIPQREPAKQSSSSSTTREPWHPFAPVSAESIEEMLPSSKPAAVPRQDSWPQPPSRSSSINSIKRQDSGTPHLYSPASQQNTKLPQAPLPKQESLAWEPSSASLPRQESRPTALSTPSIPNQELQGPWISTTSIPRQDSRNPQQQSPAIEQHTAPTAPIPKQESQPQALQNPSLPREERSLPRQLTPIPAQNSKSPHQWSADPQQLTNLSPVPRQASQQNTKLPQVSLPKQESLKWAPSSTSLPRQESRPAPPSTPSIPKQELPWISTTSIPRQDSRNPQQQSPSIEQHAAPTTIRRQDSKPQALMTPSMPREEPSLPRQLTPIPAQNSKSPHQWSTDPQQISTLSPVPRQTSQPARIPSFPRQEISPLESTTITKQDSRTPQQWTPVPQQITSPPGTPVLGQASEPPKSHNLSLARKGLWPTAPSSPSILTQETWPPPQPTPSIPRQELWKQPEATPSFPKQHFQQPNPSLAPHATSLPKKGSHHLPLIPFQAHSVPRQQPLHTSLPTPPRMTSNPGQQTHRPAMSPKTGPTPISGERTDKFPTPPERIPTTSVPLQRMASTTQKPSPAVPSTPVTRVGNILQKQMVDVNSHFNLERVLGRGQFGTTYLCTERMTGLKYACKSISKRKLVKRTDIEDMRRELMILQHLSGQPNIVEFKGAYEDDESVHIVMELCSGGELFDRITAKGIYSEQKAAAVFREIMTVVHVCHFMGVMHRDLKPENFLFSSNAEDAKLKAIDFGLSVFIEEGKQYELQND